MRLDFDTLFCAHNPCPKNGKRHLSRKLDYLVTLKQEVMALHQKGIPPRKSSAASIRERIDGFKWITMGNASFAHMVRSALKSVP